MNTAFIFIITQFVAIAVLFFLFIYCKLQKSSEMQKYASILILASMLMLLGYSLEMVATNIESAYYGTIVSYIGEPFVLVSAFLLICTFYGKRVPKWLFVVMMLCASCISIMVLTNKFHHGYYSNVGFDINAEFSPLILTHGPLYLFNILSCIVYSVGLVVVIINGYVKSNSPLKKRLSVYSMLMVCSAMLGFILYFTDIAGGYDTTMLGLSVGVVFLSVLFFRCRIFDVVDMAKDYALDISSEGLVVFDDSNSIVYENDAAQKVLREIIPKSYVLEAAEGESIYRHEQEVYSVNAYSICHKGDYIGKSIEIHDVTETYSYQERLERTIKAIKEKLENIQRTVFGSFASLVEARSLETGDHIRRVSRYTEIIAKNLQKMGKHADILTDEYVDILVASAPLHDLGKISVLDTILLKPGKLTDEEFEEMKKHAINGEKIIRSTLSGLESEEYIKMAAEVALYHHEKWDGTGYPEGLKGEEIPLSARIVALADCYDAMTSKRCYKAAYPYAEAFSIIQRESGTHFDPDVVQAFFLYMEAVQ